MPFASNSTPESGYRNSILACLVHKSPVPAGLALQVRRSEYGPIWSAETIMVDCNSVSALRLRELFSYDPNTGVIAHGPLCSKRHMIGKQVKNCSAKGYLRAYVDGEYMYAHRVAWAHYYGEWPNGQIDHIDGNRGNNAISNLRDVSPEINAQNLHNPKRNNLKSRFLGVGATRTKGKFHSMIQFGNTVKYLGRFDSEEEASAAYVAAKRKYHPGCTI